VILSASQFLYAEMTDYQLKSLRLTMRLRLMAFDTPARAAGVVAANKPIYQAIYDAADAELSRREQGDK
jgi:hypothetical protein